MTPPRPIEVADIGWVHDLNQLHAVELSLPTREQLAEMVARATDAKAVDREAALLLAFEQDADYDSPNFLWFRDHFPRFLYVDRIAVWDGHQRGGFTRTSLAMNSHAGRAWCSARSMPIRRTRPRTLSTRRSASGPGLWARPGSRSGTSRCAISRGSSPAPLCALEQTLSRSSARPTGRSAFALSLH